MNMMGTSVDSIPFSTVTKVPVESLKLDPLNPRLLNSDSSTTDHEIIAQLYRSEDLGELLQSIAANGYLDIEPLIVLSQQAHFIVLEGNRRLAAIRLFRQPGLAGDLYESEGLRVTVPEISEERLATLNEVSVYRVESREDARSFIGFKHINGAAKWESYAKAKFAADWYRAGDTSLADIAERIGDKHDTVKRMVNAIYVLEQAEEAEVFDIDDRVSPRFNFSHLYTALSRASYMRYLGLATAWSKYHPAQNPVPADNVEQLARLLRWIYGSKDESVEAVIASQNPDIKHLGEVLASEEGLLVLEKTGSLPQAYESILPANRQFSEALVRARQEIRVAANSLRGFDGRDSTLLNIAEDICETAQAMHDRMKKKARDAAVSSE